jgi:hypothetical protein
LTVMIERRGVPTIPDWPRIVAEMPPTLIALLRHIFDDAIANDNAVFLEMHVAMLNEWDTWPQEKKHAASQEAEERFFTEEAAERQETDRKEALKVVMDEEGEEGILFGPDGTKLPTM